MLPKRTPIRSKALRQSARGQTCTLRLPGCTHDPETVVLCHLPFAQRGMGYKVDDYVSAYGCSVCHDIIDGRVRVSTIGSDEVVFAMIQAMAETQRRMIDAGLITIRGAK